MDAKRTKACRYVLKNAMRDWSSEGAAERRQSYGRICDELQRRKPVGEGVVNVLVRGCGLGRLPYDLAKLGYQAEVSFMFSTFHTHH